MLYNIASEAIMHRLPATLGHSEFKANHYRYMSSLSNMCKVNIKKILLYMGEFYC